MPSIPQPPENFKNFRVMENIGEHLPLPDCNLKTQIQPRDSVLLLRLSALGDSIRLLPAVEYLRRNNHRGEIGVAVEPPLEQLFENYPRINHVHSLPLKSAHKSPRQLLKKITSLRRQKYDWLFDCHGLFKSGLVSFFSRARQRIGPHRSNSKEGNFFFQERQISAQPAALPRILFYLQMLRPFTKNFTLSRSLITPRGFCFTDIDQKVKFAAKKNPILIHPRSSHGRYGQAKEWGTNNFAELIAQITQIYEDKIYITWGPGEQQTALDISEDFSNQVQPAPETSSLLDLAFLVNHARAVICVDTLISHLADLQQTPLVVLYTASSFHINAPLFAPFRSLTTTVSNKTPDTTTVFNALKDLL